jgi:hypothetical protein
MTVNRYALALSALRNPAAVVDAALAPESRKGFSVEVLMPKI